MSASVRLPWQQPFASNSVWNAGIGANAQWASNSDPAVQTLDSLNGAVNSDSWSLPSYVGTANDPLVTITDTDPLGPVPPQTLHVPLDAVRPGGSDGQMSFYDETQPGKVWSYWNVTFNNGHDPSGGLTAGLGSVYDSTGDGFSAPSYSPQQIDYNYVGGVINSYDLANGAINHMLRIATSPGDTAMPPGSTAWNQGIPWPDTHTDYNGPNGEYTGDIPAGSTFGIPASVDLNSLGLSTGGMMLAKALQDYGAIWKDVGGSHQFTVYTDGNEGNNPLVQQMQADFSKIMPHLDLMTNQGPNSVNGGGPSIAPPALPLSLDGSTPTAADTTTTGNTGTTNTDTGNTGTTGTGVGTTDTSTADAGNTGGPDSTATSGIVLGADDTSPTIAVSDTTVHGSSNYDLTLDASNDSVTLTGTDNTITIDGSGNTVNPGSGNVSIVDNGSNNTLTLPAAGGHADLSGNFLTNGDLLDFRPLLAGTSWSGSSGDLSQYLHVARSGADAVISVSPTAGGSATPAVTLHDAGSLSFGALQPHLLTS